MAYPVEFVIVNNCPATPPENPPIENAPVGPEPIITHDVVTATFWFAPFESPVIVELTVPSVPLTESPVSTLTLVIEGWAAVVTVPAVVADPAVVAVEAFPVTFPVTLPVTFPVKLPV